MAEAKSIEALSVMFTAGVAVGALVSSGAPWLLPAILLPAVSLAVFSSPLLRRSKAGPAVQQKIGGDIGETVCELFASGKNDGHGLSGDTA